MSIMFNQICIHEEMLPIYIWGLLKSSHLNQDGNDVEVWDIHAIFIQGESLLWSEFELIIEYHMTVIQRCLEIVNSWLRFMPVSKGMLKTSVLPSFFATYSLLLRKKGTKREVVMQLL